MKTEHITNTRQIVDQFISDVQSGEFIACNFIKLSVKRYINDINKGHKRGLFFDEVSATRSVLFFKLLNHSKGKFAGLPFVPEPWQVFVLWNIFGWKDADGYRRFNYVYLEIARKNGKSTFAAAIALLMFVFDKESGAEIYSAATKRDQAKIVFNEARNMVKQSPELRKRVRIYQHNLHVEETGSKFEPLSSDSDSLDGLGPHCSIVDEYHAHKTAELYNVLKSGMGARTQPIQFTVTTAGFNKEAPCFKLRKICDDILNERITDDSTFTMIFTLDKDDDWEDPKNWKKSNPNFDSIDTLPRFLEREYKQAKSDTSFLVNFLTKNLNIWTDSEDVWIEDELWKANNHGPLPEMEGEICYGGLDLSSIRDLTALTFVFPNIEEKHQILQYFFMPEMNYKERVSRDGVNYDAWIREGHIIITPGNVIDYDFIRDKILEIDKKYSIKKIAYDRWNSSQIVAQLIDEYIPMEPFGQGYASMNPACNALLKFVIEKKYNHAGNPILRWMNSNIAIRRDPAGNIKFDKSKVTEKIDGMVSLAMATGVMIEGTEYYSEKVSDFIVI